MSKKTFNSDNYNEFLDVADDISLSNQLSELIVAHFGSLKAFCDQASMNYSTVHNILHRGTIGGASVNSIITICDFLRIDFDSLARGVIIPLHELESPVGTLTVPSNVPGLFLSRDEQDIIAGYRASPAPLQKAIRTMLDEYIHPDDAGKEEYKSIEATG